LAIADEWTGTKEMVVVAADKTSWIAMHSQGAAASCLGSENK